MSWLIPAKEQALLLEYPLLNACSNLSTTYGVIAGFLPAFGCAGWSICINCMHNKYKHTLSKKLYQALGDLTDKGGKSNSLVSYVVLLGNICTMHVYNL